MEERDALCGRVLGEFVIRERIGEGGFGAVYRCEQPLLGREAVVKVLHSGLRTSEVVLQRFMREAQLASKLDHPYAAHVYAFGIDKEDGLCWIAMELVQGTAFDRWLRDRGKLSIDQLVPFLERVAEVVQTAHERGIVHRDLKPSNIMVVERAGRLLPKLLDFGIAKMFDPAAVTRTATPPVGVPVAVEGDARTFEVAAAPKQSEIATIAPVGDPTPVPGASTPLTQAGATMGSPPYMAPEQWDDAAQVGPSADLYALAIIAFEALTGRRPFTAKTVAAFAEAHYNAPIPSLGETFSPTLDRFFQRALAKSASSRPGTALELAAALRVAAGIGTAPEDLPRLDESIRDAWLADAPQPLAEAVAQLDGARNVHQARDAAREIVRGLVRYVLAVALAARAQVRGERVEPALAELLRALRRRELEDEERVKLARMLVQPFAERRGAHPLPPLVELLLADDAFAPALALYATSDLAGSEDVVRSQLARAMPAVARLMRAAAFVLDYGLVVPRERVPERWMGIRRARRTSAVVRDREIADGESMLVDRDGHPVLVLAPLVQTLRPTIGADPELFVFDGRGRHGARLTASPAGFEHDDPGVWEWFSEHVLGDADGASDARVDERPPYLGLSSFSTEDADRFVGREREVEALVNRLRKQPLQIVVGPSGAGKSSFVHAAVVPSLPAGWRVVTLRPGTSPLAALASRVGTERLRDGMLVVIVDQLEELFTLGAAAEERAKFAAELVRLSSDAEASTRVICTVRDDFLMNIESLEALRPVLSPALFLLGNPSREDLVRMVVEPARRSGYEPSDGELARDMVDVVADRPGALALVSFTASRLWELRDRRFRQLTRKAYDAMGGVAGALGQHAEETFSALVGDEQRVAREAFRHLVTAENTRAVLARAELTQRLAHSRAEAVLDRLIAARLLAVVEGEAGAQLEIIHETLIAAWPRLQQWTREDVGDTRMREQVRSAAKQWTERGRASELLWRGDLLAELQVLRGRGMFSDAEAGFAEASLQEAARRRRNVRLATGGAFAVLVAVVIGLVLLTARAKAAATELHDNLQSQFENQGRRLVLANSPLEALAYLAKAAELGETGRVHDFLVAQAVRATDGERFEIRHDNIVHNIRFSPDGTRFITPSLDHTARIVDAHDGKVLVTLHHAGTVRRGSFSPDGKTVLTAGADGVAILWDATSGAELHRFTHTGAVSCAELSHDGRFAVTTGDDDVIAVWELPLATLRFRVHGTGAGIASCDISLDGKAIAAIDTQGIIRTWDAATGSPRRELRPPTPEAGYYSVRFDRDGVRLIAGSFGSDAIEWDVTTGAVLHVLHHKGDVNSAEFGPDGKTIVTGSDDHTAVIWDADTGEAVTRFTEHTAGVRSAAFSRDGRYVVTASEDASVLLWDAKSGRRLARWLGHVGIVYDASISPDGALAVSAGDDGRAIAWTVAPQEPTVWLTGHTSYVQSAQFSSDGMRVLTSSSDGTARIWDAKTGEVEHVLAMSGGEVANAAFSHDGKQVATTGADGTVQLWDAGSGAPGAKWSGGNGRINQLSWSRDDASIATANEDGTLRSWSVKQGKLELENHGHDGKAVTSAVFAPNDAEILTTGDDLMARRWSRTGALLGEHAAADHFYTAMFDRAGTRVVSVSRATATIWNPSTGAHERELVGHAGLVMRAEWSPDGAEVITAAADGTARIWDAATGDEIAMYRPEGRARIATYSPDGRRIAIGNDDGSVAIHDLPPTSPTAIELERILLCRVPFVVNGDRLESRARSCDRGPSR